MDYQLMKLEDNLNHWRRKFENCHKFFKQEYFLKYEQAKNEYAAYYRTNYPTAKIEPQQFKPFERLADKTENFENFDN
jgi:5-bromo-4-chloroindolyl phosphate hydrolysis protein